MAGLQRPGRSRQLPFTSAAKIAVRARLDEIGVTETIDVAKHVPRTIGMPAANDVQVTVDIANADKRDVYAALVSLGHRCARRSIGSECPAGVEPVSCGSSSPALIAASKASSTAGRSSTFQNVTA